MKESDSEMCHSLELSCHKILTNAVPTRICQHSCLGVFITIKQCEYLLVAYKALYLCGSSFQRSCQQDTDIKNRLLHNQCLKCDYDQMCTQIVSEAEDFVISHRCMFLEQSFMSCLSKTISSCIVKFLPSGKKNE